MKLHGWQKVGSAEEYREMIRDEYARLKREQGETGQTTGLSEVKLRLFLSLLERPSSDHQSPVADQTEEWEARRRPAA